MLDFAFRNLLLYFRDRTAVILSFLSEFIMIVLYFLFLRNNLLASFSQIENAELLIDSWMVSGILGIASVSATIGSYGTLVDDKCRKIYRDFSISPISKIHLLLGYLTSASLIGFVVTFILFLISECYIYIQYGVYLGADHIWSIYGILFLTTISNASLTLMLISFIKSNHALAACCTIVGALIGFLTGIYLPMGSLPKSVKMLVTTFPVSHSAVLFRQILTEPFVIEHFGSLDTKPAKSFMEYMGIYYSCNGQFLPQKISVMVLLATTLICLIISAFKHLRFSD